MVARDGLPALNRVWSTPAALPSLSELDDPVGWMVRVRAEALKGPRSLGSGTV